MTAPAPEPFWKSLERMNLFQEPEARTLIADLRLPEGSRGLDVGCGAGLFAVWLAEAIGARGRVVGIEPSAGGGGGNPGVMDDNYFCRRIASPDLLPDRGRCLNEFASHMGADSKRSEWQRSVQMREVKWCRSA